MATRVRFAEYEFVTKQSKNKALCPFCDKWHSTETGLALAGDCPGLYVRVRKAAFVVVALKKGRAGVVDGEYAAPEGRNLQRAIAHASAARNPAH